MLDFAEPDECCGPALSAALLSGILEAIDEWTHEECGCRWLAHYHHGVRHWLPQSDVLVFPF